MAGNYQSRFEPPNPSDLIPNKIGPKTRQYTVHFNHPELEMIWRGLALLEKEGVGTLTAPLRDAKAKIQASLRLARGHRAISGTTGLTDMDERRYGIES